MVRARSGKTVIRRRKRLLKGVATAEAAARQSQRVCPATRQCDAYRVSSSHFGRRSSASWRAGSLVPTCARPLGVETAPVRTFTGRPGVEFPYVGRYAPLERER